MYSMPMSSLFNFHLKMDESQHHQLPFQNMQTNGMFMKKDVVLGPEAHLMSPPMAHNSQPLNFATHPTVPTSVPPGASLLLPKAQPQQLLDSFIVEQHITINKSNTKPYQCNYCGKSYKQITGVTNHLKVHHQRTTAEVSTSQNCTVCGKSLAHYSSTDKTTVCSNCRNQSRSDHSRSSHNNQSQQQHSNQLHQHSQQSHNIINYHQELAQNLRTVHSSGSLADPELEDDNIPDSQKQYKCQTCQKRFQHSSSLKMHLKKHTDDKPYHCTHCGKAFKRNSSLKIHERTHTGDKTHECVYCGKLFAYEVFLKVHLRKHTGEKPYQCQLCDKSFTQAGNMKSHIKRKHAGSDDILNIVS